MTAEDVLLVWLTRGTYYWCLSEAACLPNHTQLLPLRGRTYHNYINTSIIHGFLHYALTTYTPVGFS